MTQRVFSGKKHIAATITVGIPAANAASPQATATAAPFPAFVHLPPW
jgi:hypothetical protein